LFGEAKGGREVGEGGIYGYLWERTGEERETMENKKTKTKES
jgi:hypothetical protein